MTDPLAPRLVTVFGGSGFIGKHVVRALVADGWRVRVPMRRPHVGLDLKVMGTTGQVQLVQANMRYPDSVAAAVAGSDAVVNLVALLFEKGQQTFEALHVDAVRTLADACAAHGVANVAHISAIGADAESESDYARTKAQGEAILRARVPTADILRPSIVFGPEDEFFNRFAGMSTLAPALPLIGGGDTRMQPVFAGDVAAAVAKVLDRGTTGKTFELGGPNVYTFRELMAFMLRTVDRKRMLVPLPWGVAAVMGTVSDFVTGLPLIRALVNPPITRDQVELLKSDNVVADSALGFADLGITPTAMEAVVPTYLVRYRKRGQFHTFDEVEDHAITSDLDDVAA